MKGRMEVSIISHRCVTSSYLKQERSVFRGSVFDIFASGCSSAHPAKKMKRQKNNYFAHIFLMLKFPSLFITPPPLPTRYFLMTVLFLNQDCNTLCVLIWQGLFMCWKCVITNVLIFGCMASKFMCLSFSTLHSTDVAFMENLYHHV